jgi:hypothetical protein
MPYLAPTPCFIYVTLPTDMAGAWTLRAEAVTEDGHTQTILTQMRYGPDCDLPAITRQFNRTLLEILIHIREHSAK